MYTEEKKWDRMIKKEARLVREQHISEILENMKETMLHAISREDPEVFECFKVAHVDVSSLPIRLNLASFFDSVWLWAKKSGMDLPTAMCWTEDFDEFYTQLKRNWPIDSFFEANLKFKRVKRSNMKVKHEYLIERT